MLVPIALSSLVLFQASGGLVMIDTILGTGAAAEKGDVVTVLYKGSLQTGKVFDSTEKKPPFAFELGAKTVIPGWETGVEGMKAGGKRVLSIPPKLAYGDKAVGELPPNSTLIFEIELLRVDKKDAKPEIKIEELSQGEGKACAAGDEVEVHYRGAFLNGVMFDSSYERAAPLSLKIGETRLIAGFTQGVTGMKQGSRRRVTIPYPLAYGPAGRGGVIPAFATLVFELELVRLKQPSSGSQNR